MRIQCAVCREIVAIGAFRCADNGIEITCSDCGESYFLSSSGHLVDTESDIEPEAPHESAATAVGSSPAHSRADADEMECPKCGRCQPRADACCACGLRAERFGDFQVTSASDAADAGAVSAELVGLWRYCEEHWDSESAHQNFLEAAIQAAAFRYAARCYRGAARERPGDASAAAALQRLERMVAATLMSSSSKHDGGGRRYSNAVLLVCFLVLVAGIGGMYLLTAKTSVRPAERPAVNSGVGLPRAARGRDRSAPPRAQRRLQGKAVRGTPASTPAGPSRPGR